MTKKTNYSDIKVLQSGKRDSRILLTLWFAKRTFAPLVLLGIIGSFLAQDVGDNPVDYSDIESIFANLLGPFVSLAMALLIKIIVNWLALLAAVPVLHERGKKLGTENYGYFFTRALDRWQILKGLRALRWTHHVRMEAAKNLDSRCIKNGKLDKAFDIANIILVVVLFASFIIVTS